MRVTIIPSDNLVVVDSVSPSAPLDLTPCNIPNNIHALQWFDTMGWIEFVDRPFDPKEPNQTITELPEWANAAIQAWNDAKLQPTPEPTEPPAP